MANPTPSAANTRGDRCREVPEEQPAPASLARHHRRQPARSKGGPHDGERRRKPAPACVPEEIFGRERGYRDERDETGGGEPDTGEESRNRSRAMSGIRQEARMLAEKNQ